MVHFRKREDIPEISLTISFQTYLRLAILIALTLIIWSAIHKATHPIILIFTAFFLTLALNGPVYWISKRIPGKRRGSRVLATTISFLIVIILLGAFLASIVPPLVTQTENLINAAPHLIKEFHSQNSPIGSFIRHYHLQKQVNDISSQLAGRVKSIEGSAFSTATKIGSSFFSMLVIVVLTFMMLIEGPRWVDFFKRVLPSEHHDTAERMMKEMYQVIKGYVNGQVLLAALAAVLIIPAVLLLGISYPAALLVVIFICGLIPLVGHTIGAVIVTLVALFHSTTAAIIILAYYLLYMQIEAYIIQPRIQSSTTNLTPLMVFASVIIGVSFGGLFGGLVAIPVAGCLKIALLEYLRSQKIIDAPTAKKAIEGTK